MHIVYININTIVCINLFLIEFVSIYVYGGTIHLQFLHISNKHAIALHEPDQKNKTYSAMN